MNIGEKMRRAPVRSGSPKTRGVLAGVCVLALAGMLSSCGGSSTPSTTTTLSPSQVATAQIRANWIAFFAGTTAAKTKIGLLENGSEFASVINGQASSAMARSVSSKVTSVTNITATSATVRYDVFLGKTKALAGSVGSAVKVGGVWKVSVRSFCVLLGLEGVKMPICPSS